jgi:hypothetical protein
MIGRSFLEKELLEVCVPASQAMSAHKRGWEPGYFHPRTLQRASPLDHKYASVFFQTQKGHHMVLTGKNPKYYFQKIS